MRLLNLAYTSIYVITIIPEAHPLILTATLLAIPHPSLSVVTVAKCSANIILGWILSGIIYTRYLYSGCCLSSLVFSAI